MNSAHSVPAGELAAFDTSPWLVRFRPVRAPTLRLFTFSYAGGGAWAYRKWPGDVLPGVEVVGIQLPGRQTRIREPAIRHFDRVVAAIADALMPHLDIPFAFFGHSLGAIMSFEVARALRNRQRSARLRALVVSACAAPHLRNADDRSYDLPHDRFVEKLRKLNGTPPEVLACPELLELVIPALRADFCLAYTYRYDPHRYPPDRPFDVPIHVFAGELDGLRDSAQEGVSAEQLAGWQRYTTARTPAVRIFPGDHFFVHSHHDLVLAALNNILGELLACAAA